ncbi:LytR family transcriptional regulator [Staphylococcus condimenti]|uniref:LCP family protein n=1 Tax=Staphylococcus condimenti TaxID=70255 RepID=A0A4Q7CLS8_9STAP|nr:MULTISPECIES: LCP family protein [Staphylococcus]MDK8644208.1 LCP family protein [Staphylococcus condimenti]PNZ62725.1 LytR family transcriptional regulator [Staphylococcus condimenti]QQS84031.1 LCP family protein [Staphylococcus condimenti]QRP96773.1 LCP family protein [Staphylococcus condimenti]RZI00385.1 LytR family transcriptional regulator [Staphylococcus condimenti]
MGTVPKVLLWAFGILVLLAVIAAIYLAVKIFAVGGNIHNPLDRNKSELRKEKVDLNKGEPFSIALFGVDSDAERKSANGGERSDSIMVLSINPDKKKTEIVSIPRDTQAEIVGRGTTEKINHAYAYGGPNMAVKSLEKLMDVPIDHYATIDMDGMHGMVDALGGVDVVSNSTFSTDGYNFVKGEKSHLDGDKALAFIRSRKEEGAGGDFGRQERQQLVLQGIANELTSVKSITNFNSVTNEIEKNVKTDLTLGELNTIRSKYKNANDNVRRHQLQGNGGIQDDGLYYFVPDESSLENMTELLKSNLDL